MKSVTNRKNFHVIATRYGEIAVDEGSVDILELSLRGIMNPTFVLRQPIKIKLPECPKKFPRKDRLAVKCDLISKRMSLIYIKNPSEITISLLPYDRENMVYAKIADIILLPNGAVGVINYG